MRKLILGMNVTPDSHILSAELRWSLHAHAQLANRTTWDLATIQRVVNHCRYQRVPSLVDLGEDDTVTSKLNANIRMIGSERLTVCGASTYSPTRAARLSGRRVLAAK